DSVACLAGADAEANGEMRLAGAGWAQEDHVGGFGGEVEGGEVGDRVAFDGALKGEVEVLEGLASGEAGRAGPGLTALVPAGCDFAFEAGGQVLLVGPTLRSSTLAETVDSRRKARCLERPAQICDVRGRFGLGGHQFIPTAWSYTARSRCSTSFSAAANALVTVVSARMSRRVRAWPGCRSSWWRARHR